MCKLTLKRTVDSLAVPNIRVRLHFCQPAHSVIVMASVNHRPEWRESCQLTTVQPASPLRLTRASCCTIEPSCRSGSGSLSICDPQPTAQAPAAILTQHSSPSPPLHPSLQASRCRSLPPSLPCFHTPYLTHLLGAALCLSLPPSPPHSLAHSLPRLLTSISSHSAMIRYHGSRKYCANASGESRDARLIGLQ